MIKPKCLRWALATISVCTAVGGATEDVRFAPDDGGPTFALPFVERILYVSGMRSGLVSNPFVLADGLSGECRVVCECTCSGNHCVMACRIECEVPSDWCQTRPEYESQSDSPTFESNNCI